MSSPDPTLYDLVRDGFIRVERRQDDIVEQLRTMNGRVTSAHVTLAAHTSQLDAHGSSLNKQHDRIETVAARTHTLANALNAASADDGAVSVRAMKWYLAVAGGSIGVTIACLKFLGKL